MSNPIWITPGSNIGSYVNGITMSFTFLASPSDPSNGVYYTVYSGSLPVGLSLSSTGILSGIPAGVSVDIKSTFVIRATQYNNNLIVGYTDRTFSTIIVNNPPSWVTSIGNIGSFNQLETVNFTFVATSAGAGNTIRYNIINGSLPAGLSTALVLNETTGVLSGIPARVTRTTTSTFVIRATEYSGTEIVGASDRVFRMSIIIPQPIWITNSGSIGNFAENIPINYAFLATAGGIGDTLAFKLLNGQLPNTGDVNNPMILSTSGVLTGLPSEVANNVTSTFTVRIEEYSGSTLLSFADRTFSATVIGPDTPIFTSTGPWTYTDSQWVSNQLTYTNLDPNTTVNITVVSGNLPDGLELSSTGLIQGYPSIPSASSITHIFTLRISNGTLSSDQAFSITINLNTETRLPTIYNNRPPKLNMSDDEYYPYYFSESSMGTYQQNNVFIFKIIGHDFDDEELTYNVTGLNDLGLNPDDVSCNTSTGWIYGTFRNDLGPTSNTYAISAQVSRTANSAVMSPIFNYTLTLSGTLDTKIIWISQANLGQIFNGSVSTKRVLAASDLQLDYSIISGNLPANLTMTADGEITGRLPFESTSEIQSINKQTVYTFTVRANTAYSGIFSDKTFTLTTVQKHIVPYDNLYIRAYPSMEQKTLYRDLITNTTLIPNASIYRPDDFYFGRRTDIVYNHMYGIPSNMTLEYVESVIKNHYRRNITLGELKTARATDESGATLYEVVYSEVIDDLVNLQDQSISKIINWPRPIPVNNNTDTVQTLYPASLDNMRTQIADNLGLINDTTLLPLWMYSQQTDGNTLGYVQAVVLCYTKPGWAQIIVNNINDVWQYKLNEIDFQLDRFEIDKTISYEYDSTIALWNPSYNSSTVSWESNLPSSAAANNVYDIYVYFSKNILTEAKNQNLPLFGLPIKLTYDLSLGSGTSITLPLKGTVDVDVDWGDGSISSYSTAGNYSHTYSTSDVYSITVSGLLTGYGSESVDNTNLVGCTSWGDTGLTDLSYAFYNATNLTVVPITTQDVITNTSHMFYGATNFNYNIARWTLNNTQNMSSMFESAQSFNQDIGRWKVNSAINMNSMFKSATNFNQNLSNWCVLSISEMPEDFSTDSALTIGNMPVWGSCPDNQ